MSRSFRAGGLLLLAGVAACGGGASTSGSSPEDVATGLLPAVQVEGEEVVGYGIEERMARWRVPGVSVAVMDDGEIAWARGWGIADGETGRPVDAETLFQAASISKPVAALAAMSLVEEGALQLDGSVNERLTSWAVPESPFSSDSAVTLRGLLSHTAGLTVWGFPGYRKDEPFEADRLVASNVDVLDGAGNTDPVRLFREPGTGWRYSGGGYTVMEQMVEDVTGRPFEAVAGERVLQPAGMSRSTFEQPLPEPRWTEAARGHGADGTEVAGEWHTYPEQAAAGLWTTPTDLLTLSAHLLRILRGEAGDGVVSAESLRRMLHPHRAGEDGFESYGLGFSVDGEGDALTFGHGGSNAGFKAQWVVYPERGDGAVVMTNGDQGSLLAAEVLRAVSTAYGWPGHRPEVRASRAPSQDELAAYVGRYEAEGEGPAVLVAVGSGALEGRVEGRTGFVLRAAADRADTFFDPEDGQTVSFERDANGDVVALVVEGEVRLGRVGP